MMKFVGSMSTRITSMMILVTVIPVVLLQLFYTNYMIDRLRENRVSVVKDYCVLFGDEMLEIG